MILQLNHLQAKAAGVTAHEVLDTLYGLLAEGHLEPEQFARLRVQLDWVQYRHNFRECVMALRADTDRREPLGPLEVQIDTRQVTPGTLRAELLRTMASIGGGTPADSQAVVLEDFQPFRNSIAWGFNRLYWHRLPDWEQFTGRGYEQALPGGKSDANHPAAVADCVADFWTLLRDLESRKQLPEELFVLEIGVGMGKRAGLWLDRFHALDRERGTHYYPRLKFLLGDYSLSTLERSRPAVHEHLDLCSFVVLDALNPMKNLAFLRHKILHVHLTNVYDNLPDEEMARRDGRLYAVQVRAYVPMEEARRIAGECEVPLQQMPRTVTRLLEGGPDYLHDRNRGLAFWQGIWKAMRLEERLVSLDELPDVALPEGLDRSQLEDALNDAPSDVRFHVSSGALQSFRNTLALLHPRGFLQVQDIFVKSFDEYRLGFHGPGKLDGSIVNWVNGPLLREVGERAGYDVHFAPFKYREGSRTSILYTTQRE
jgi:hypothetical protein